MSQKQPARGGARSVPPRAFATGILLFVSGAVTALALVWMFGAAITAPNSNLAKSGGTVWGSEEKLKKKTAMRKLTKTFYDDPKVRYAIGEPVAGWDEKRREWLRVNPAFGDRGSPRPVSERVMVVTGSQLTRCKNPIGDNLSLRSLKNKVDYCRINGYDIFYNNLLLQPKMAGCWAKLPAIKAAMIAHPETEWVLWVDVDAFFMDMEFKFPFDRYEGYNLVVEGWNTYKMRTFTSLNAGVFLIRNCQWSMDFIEKWASMGPTSPDYAKWGVIQQALLKDKSDVESDDQSALLYLMLEKGKIWGDKIFLEEELNFQTHWVGSVEQLRNLTLSGVERDRLRRRRAEKATDVYDTKRRVEQRGLVGPPIMMHFAGCQPCSGKHNPAYGAESCWAGMEQALTYADNQVLRSFGLAHMNLSDPGAVSPLKRQ
uniref:Uncharacterized protein n=1 Tax=Kalanchoe fedtschenkoi TaxID=63787 RepID=A0A7N0TMU2_KALFE